VTDKVPRCKLTVKEEVITAFGLERIGGILAVLRVMVDKIYPLAICWDYG
jgi:hypothetical protein